ncbi:MAG TPA: isoaspartyl peptidase/L-asparaginase [Ohtaekwangia sp.]|nr:isoaspartyl peptidase/L-asparaginase [Ohtaekwangia sp.]
MFMKYALLFMISGILMHCTNPAPSVTEAKTDKSFPITLVIHGGAGTITRENLSPEKEQAYRVKLKEAIDSGYAQLATGKTSIEAVVTVVSMLEDSPLFNAGKGAVFTNEGKNELDASIMDGQTLMAGAVAGVTNIKNPIKAALTVMTKSPHVMLVGSGAEQFAAEHGLEIVDPSYFKDAIRYERWKKEHEKKQESSDKKFGTVGCVALDRFGNIAAGTSTGGMMNKKWGRIGDSPIIGAGTYAKNTTCGISATGWGEYFMRLAIAYDISAQIEYGGRSLEEAAAETIMKKLPDLGGDGGIIALNQQGEIVMKFNTAGMFRGYKRQGEEAKTFLFRDE